MEKKDHYFLIENWMVDNLCKIEFPSHKDTLRQNFGWNWSSGSGEDDFKISMSMYICYFIILSPWKKEWPLIWTYLNSLHLRLLCVMFGWNKPSGSGDFLKILSTYFRYFFLLFPLGKGWGPSFEQTWIHFIQECFVPSLVEIGIVVLEKKIF